MSQWQEQIIINANAIQALIDNSKKIGELPPLGVPLNPLDKFAVQLDATGQTVYATIADLNLATFNPSFGGISKGDMLVYDGADWINIGVGTNGQVLSANSVTATGLEWITTGGLQTLDQVLTQGNTSTQTARLGKLEIDSANSYLDTAAGVLKMWNSNDIQIKNYTNNTEVYLTWLYGIGLKTSGFYGWFKGTNLTESRTYEMPDASGTLALSINGYVANAQGEITIPGASFPLTTKGDIFTYSTLEDRLPVGTNGQVLSADSAENTGLKWITLGAGSGDMILANAQTNTGTKTFLDTTFKLRNVGNTFDGYFVNTNTADRIYTLQNANGTLAFLSDITGTNSGTNTGDQSLTNSSNATSHTVTLSGGTSFQLVEGTNITLTTTGTGANGILTINATGGGGDDVSTFAEKTGALVGTDRLVGLSGVTDFSETISGIPLSIFNNDAGWTSNVGTVTSVTGGTGITSSGGATPDIALAVNELGVTTMVTGDWIVFDDAGTSRKALISSIPLSIFNNDSGWTSNTGNVTKVGTPVNDQVGVWTGDGTIEGNSNFTFDSVTKTLHLLATTSGAGLLIGSDVMASVDAYITFYTSDNTDDNGIAINSGAGSQSIIEFYSDQFKGATITYNDTQKRLNFVGSDGLNVDMDFIINGVSVFKLDLDGTLSAPSMSNAEITAKGATALITKGYADANYSLLNADLQTLANTSDATTHTLTLSDSGGSIQLVEGANITLTTTGTGLNGIVTIAATGGGFTNLTQFVSQTAWRIFYSDSLGDVVELALGGAGTYLQSNGAALAPTWVTPGGGGDMLLGTIQTVTAAKNFNDDTLAIWNPAGTFKYIFSSSALITADKTVTLPLLTASDTFVFEAFAQTLTNKTVNLTSNTLSGTKAQFDTALSDGNFMYVGDAPTAHTLDSHSNVTITANSSGEILKWNGSAWINNTLAEANISAVGHTHTLSNVTDVTALASEVNLLDLSGLTIGWVLSADSATTASWKAPTGGGNVTKVGTPLDNQVGVWTGDGTIEGTTGFTFDSTLQELTIGINDNDAGLLRLKGDGAASSVGGSIIFELAADHDTTFNYYMWEVQGQDFYLSRAGFQNLFEYNFGDDRFYFNKIVSSAFGSNWGDVSGGNLNMAVNSIISTNTNGNIILNPNGTGNVQLGNYVLDGDQTVGVGQDNYVLTYDNASGLITLEVATGGSGDDVSTFAEKTGALVGTDRLVGLSGATDFSETISGIPLSIFNNDAGWTSNTGDMLLGTIQTVTALKTFNTGTLDYRNPGNTFSYKFLGSAIVADRIVTLPLLTGTDTFVFEAFAQTFTNKTINLTSNTLSGTKAQFDTAASDGNFMWVGDAPTAHTLDSHSNVTITANSAGEILKWSGSAWINNTLVEAGILGGTITDNQIAIGALTSNTIEGSANFTYDGTTFTVNGGTIVGSATTQDIFNTNATTINFGSAATTLTIGATTGTMNLRNALLVLTQVPTTDVGFATSTMLVRDSTGNLDKIVASGGGTTNFLRADGTWAAPTGGGGDVFKVGTPVNNQIGVWTGNGTLEGDTKFTFDGISCKIGIDGTNRGILEVFGLSTLTGGQVWFHSPGDQTDVYCIKASLDDFILATDTGNTPLLTYDKSATAWIVATGNNLISDTFIKSGGTSSQFLKADGTIDSSSYMLSSAILDSLSDVTITANSSGELLKWNGSAWINNTLAEAGIEPSFSKNTGFNLNLGTIAGTVSEGNHTHTFASLTSKPTTLSGYGISDTMANFDAACSDGNFAYQGQTIVVGNHGTGTTDEVVNVCYGTSATPPAAGTVTEGALYIQHSA